MTRKATPSVMLLAVLLSGCGNSSDPDAKVESVDMFLARICELAAECPGISSSEEEVRSCPSGIRSELSQSQLAQLEQFTAYSKPQQDRILQCMATSICGRFGGSVANLSDSDVMEPYQDCVSSPGVLRRAAASPCDP